MGWGANPNPNPNPDPDLNPNQAIARPGPRDAAGHRRCRRDQRAQLAGEPRLGGPGQPDGQGALHPRQQEGQLRRASGRHHGRT
eukprot:scaffold129864_cov72-Phaeocystis_antarctica.AAC.1